MYRLKAGISRNNQIYFNENLRKTHINLIKKKTKKSTSKVQLVLAFSFVLN